MTELERIKRDNYSFRSKWQRWAGRRLNEVDVSLRCEIEIGTHLLFGFYKEPHDPPASYYMNGGVNDFISTEDSIHRELLAEIIEVITKEFVKFKNNQTK